MRSNGYRPEGRIAFSTRWRHDMIGSRRLAVPSMAILIAQFMVAAVLAGTVTFKNPGSTTLELHVRDGPIDQNPDNRGSRNTTMKPVDQFDDDVGDGDTWFAYGNQIVNSSDNPPLCNAKSGVTVLLDKSQSCYVNN
jgi:hypothetical protein